MAGDPANLDPSPCLQWIQQLCSESAEIMEEKFAMTHDPWLHRNRETLDLAISHSAGRAKSLTEAMQGCINGEQLSGVRRRAFSAHAGQFGQKNGREGSTLSDGRVNPIFSLIA